MYRKQVRRRRAILVLLVVACLVLISVHFSEGEDGPLHSAQDGIAAALSPIEEGASRALKPVRDLFNWFDETFEARGENDRLTAENQELREDLLAAQQALEQGREEGKIADLVSDPELAAFEPVSATVIGRAPSTWTQTLAIDRGRNDGVAIDDPVVTGEGLIGRVSSLTGGSARVKLLTDQESNVTARVLKRGVTGIVGAEVGDPSDLVLELIDSNKDLEQGDRLVTAGFSQGALSSRFPPGIAIGEIRQSTPGERDLEQRITVEPFADLADITVVSVLTGGEQ